MSDELINCGQFYSQSACLVFLLGIIAVDQVSASPPTDVQFMISGLGIYLVSNVHICKCTCGNIKMLCNAQCGISDIEETELWTTEVYWVFFPLADL